MGAGIGVPQYPQASVFVGVEFMSKQYFLMRAFRCPAVAASGASGLERFKRVFLPNLGPTKRALIRRLR
jgi:hypothetical protein